MVKRLWTKIWDRYFEIYRLLGIVEKIFLSIIFSILTAISAQIYLKLPFTPVPVTLQTFTVLLSGILLGKNYGSLSQIFYFIGGISGIGWFYGGQSGILRPTTGYIIGFIFASYIAGYFSEKERKVFGMIFASLVIYILGILYLGIFFNKSVKDLILIGILPFIPFDIVKGLIAGLFAESIKGRKKDEEI
ncbi:MAG: biotin transporter BioY [Candidatus Omnitrophica bacterium]|nr:biotin transporter BioY [Candidatus Omnitrophota bacterium]MCM8803265.1 biotin transporter BioY [Candidatus Omnitrophota bacterium]